MRRLIGDIGGTNTRLALIESGRTWSQLTTYRNDDYGSLEEVISTYLSTRAARPEAAAFALAGPVHGGAATLTNRNWTISAAALGERFTFRHCEVVNDFSAVALGIPALETGELEQAGGASPEPSAPVAILGPGTGLGVGALVPGKGGGRVLVTEGGHASLAALSARTESIVSELRHRFEHASRERALSGQGIENIYAAVAKLEGRVLTTPAAPRIGAAAAAGTDPIAIESMKHFFDWLGAVAGDLALTYGAFGGVYIAGGIVPRYMPLFRRSGFRAAFEGKGRMRAYVARIPAYVILHEEVELLGLAASLEARLSQRPWPMV